MPVVARPIRLLGGLLIAASAALAFPTGLAGGPRLPAPAEILGFEPCADRKLATYEAIDRYLVALDAASDRLTLVEIGRSVEGRPLRLAIISSERNLRRIDRYKAIARRLALARRGGRPIDEAQARALAAEGRAIVWVDFGLHSTEVAHAQAAPLFAWRVATGDSAELRRIRDDVILLLMPNMNPDGTTLVAEWYMRHVGTPLESSRPPELYHRYVGHDNNRDWFMLTQPESRAVARQLYEEWFPQIVHNQHQAPPFPARIFVPPFADPVNPHIPALVVRGVNTVGNAISRRLDQEGKTGAISRVQFDMWWNGGMRTAPYFHNMVGILTETAHPSATPADHDAAEFPLQFRNGVPTLEPSTDYPSPYRGGPWTLRDSCEYMLTASMAVLDIGSRRREEWLYDIYRMARGAIAAGERETYVVPMTGQWDAGAAARLVETLRRGGVEIRRALEPFDAGGRQFDAGTWLIPGAQPFRAHVRDLLEPQRYPDRRVYPGGPPERPYDITGWTLSTQLGVEVIRVAEAVAVKAESVAAVRPATRTPNLSGASAAWALDPRANDAFVIVNRLRRAGVRVERLTGALGSDAERWPPGTFLVEPGPAAARVLEDAAALSVTVRSLAASPEGDRVVLGRPRLGLYRPWGGSIDEGWTRWLLEGFEFEYTTVRDADVRAGGLHDRYDVLVLPDVGYDALLNGVAAGRLPAEFTGGLSARGVAALFEFVAAGGTLVTLDSSSELPLTAFGLPVENVLDGASNAEFYVPGSLLRLDVDPSEPLAWGMPEESAAFFAHGLAFRTREAHEQGPLAAGVRAPARYAARQILLSGWALGAERLAGQAAVLEVPVERGRVVLLGFRAQHRGQPHGTFKLLFNALLGGRLSGKRR